jgi:hypothetical protein
VSKSPHLDPVWLRQKYEAEGLSTYDIGKLVGRDPKRIYQKLRDFGIPTRARGHNLAGEDNYFTMQPGAVSPMKGKHHSETTRKLLSLKATRPKPYLRGKRNGMSGRIGTTNPNYKSGSSPERQRLYASGEWKELIRSIYRRDNYRCTQCGSPKRERRGLHAHHVKPWATHPELRADPSNIVTLCRTCHERLHSKQV